MLVINQSNGQLDTGIHFTHVGDLVPDVSSYIIIGELNVKEVFDQVTTLQTLDKTLRHMVEKIPDTYSTEAIYLNQSLSLIGLKLNDIEEKIKEIKFIFNKESRKQRSVAGAIALIGAGATYVANSFLVNSLQSQISSFGASFKQLIGFSILGAKEIEENRKRITSLEKHLSKLSVHTYIKINKLEQEIEINRFISDSILLLNLSLLQLSDLEENIRTILEIVDAALSNKISASMISPEQVVQELDKIKLPGYKPVINTLEEFYSMQSYAAIKDNKFYVYITVPLINEENKFSLFKYVDAPLHLSGMNVRLSPTREYLAVSKKNTLYKELRESDLSTCLKVGRLRLCPHLRAYRKPPGDSCLFNLYIGDFKRAKCPGVVERASDTEVNLIDDNTISVTIQNGQHSQLGIIECPSNSSTGVLRRTIPAPEGVSLLKLEDKCSYSIGEIYIFPNKKDTLQFNTNICIRMGTSNIEELMKLTNKLELVKKVLTYKQEVSFGAEDAASDESLENFINKTKKLEILQSTLKDQRYISIAAISIGIVSVTIVFIIIMYIYFYEHINRVLLCLDCRGTDNIDEKEASPGEEALPE